MERVKKEVVFESQTDAIPRNLVEEVVERMLARKLPPFLQGNLGAHFQQVETLTSKVDSLGSLLSGLAQKVEAHGMDPLQQNAPKEFVQRVEAIKRRVGGLEVEMSKVPPVLASHQNYFLGLRKGVESLGKQVEHHSLLVQRGQMEVESVRVWTRGAGQKLEEIGLAQRKLGGQVDAFERKVDVLFQHDKAQLNQVCEGVDSALQQVGCSLQNVQSQIGRLEKEQPIAPPGPSSSVGGRQKDPSSTR